MGDANDPKCLGFYSVKPGKVGGRSTSPEGRAVLHQAADESFVSGQELRWAEEGADWSVVAGICFCTFLSPAGLGARKGDYVVAPSVRRPSVRPSVRPGTF